jgi:hypothetical protein
MKNTRLFLALSLFSTPSLLAEKPASTPPKLTPNVVSMRSAWESLASITPGNLKDVAMLFFSDISRHHTPLLNSCKKEIGHPWTIWRDKPRCEEGEQTPDQVRTALIKSKIFGLIAQSMDKDFSIQGIKGTAIGTPGPRSDIDLSIDCTQCTLPNTIDGLRVTLLAKIMYDLLVIHLFDQGSGVLFDTETYIDPIPFMRKHYQNIRSNRHYQNAAITLSQIQLARQLKHGLRLGAESFTMKDYLQHWPKMLLPLLKDAMLFEGLTHPLEDEIHNLARNVKILATLSKRLDRNEEGAYENFLILGIMKTFFPESYYTNEALVDVCYGQTKYSQLFRRHVEEKLKDPHSTGQLTDLTEIYQELIVLDEFIFLVSALENLAYFFHKIDNQKSAEEALANAGKYYLRVVRSLISYWKINPDEFQKRSKRSAGEKYATLYKHYQLAQHFERLKRKELPISTVEDVHNIFKNVISQFHIKQLDPEDISQETYTLFASVFATSVYKKERLDELMSSLYEKVGIYFEEDRFQVSSMQNTQKYEAASDLCLLLNLVIEYNLRDEASQKAVKRYSEEHLKQQHGRPSQTTLSFKELKGLF